MVGGDGGVPDADGMSAVAALYVESRGPYPGLVAEWFDVERDARTYSGPGPVVAHPPCERWGKLSHFSRNDTRELAIIAVDQVRRFGGVLEHPVGSRLWAECRLPPPEDMWPDEFGGRTYLVNQGDYGHRAPKPTLLYAVRLGPCPFRLPSGFDPGGRVESISKFARKATPADFAAQLVAWAATARAA